MKNWQRALIGPKTNLRQALETINMLGCQIALVVDDQNRLLGTLSDGDARRAFLRGLNLNDCVTLAMCTAPTTVNIKDDQLARLDKLRRMGLHQLPVVNDEGIVLGLQTVDDYLKITERAEWVVIMAGGLGTRLKELTKETPKPMLKVGRRPLLETILFSYAEQGFRNFYFAVNYKAEQIESYFGDGEQFGVRIRYLRETQRLGTAGPLSLISERHETPIFVTNADLLTKENYTLMIQEHIKAKADATMGVRHYELQVPFGVVREKQGKIEAIEEKPIKRFTISAGMYVLSPSALDLIPKNTYLDMPTLFEILVEKGMSTRCHYINGYWLDIGRLPDYERANVEFNEVFG